MAYRPEAKSPLPNKVYPRHSVPRVRPRTVAASRLSNVQINRKAKGFPNPNSVQISDGDQESPFPVQSSDIPTPTLRAAGYLGKKSVFPNSPRSDLSGSPLRTESENKQGSNAVDRSGNAKTAKKTDFSKELDAFFNQEKQPFYLMSEDGSGHIAECTFKPRQEPNRTEELLRGLIQEHKELRARVASQEQVIQELVGTQGERAVPPALRVLSREKGMRIKPPASEAGRRRAKSSLSCNYSNSKPSPNLLDDWLGHFLTKEPEEKPVFEVRNPPDLTENSGYSHFPKRKERQNLDTVGKSMFIYPSPDGVFQTKKTDFAYENSPIIVTKRDKSAPRPRIDGGDGRTLRFPKEVFPMMVRHRPTLD